MKIFFVFLSQCVESQSDCLFVYFLLGSFLHWLDPFFLSSALQPRGMMIPFVFSASLFALFSWKLTCYECQRGRKIVRNSPWDADSHVTVLILRSRFNSFWNLEWTMTQFLPPNLLALFAPREPIPFMPPTDKLPHEKKRLPYGGLIDFSNTFEVSRLAGQCIVNWTWCFSSNLMKHRYQQESKRKKNV